MVKNDPFLTPKNRPKNSPFLDPPKIPGYRKGRTRKRHFLGKLGGRGTWFFPKWRFQAEMVTFSLRNHPKTPFFDPFLTLLWASPISRGFLGVPIRDPPGPPKNDPKMTPFWGSKMTLFRHFFWPLFLPQKLVIFHQKWALFIRKTSFSPKIGVFS